MGTQGFLVTLFAGAAVLAIWLDVRFGERAPKELSRIVLHVIIALIALRVARVGLKSLVEPGEAVQTMLLLFGLLLPALIYVFLSSLWVLRMVRGLMFR